jgi:hypothetical protein
MGRMSALFGRRNDLTAEVAALRAEVASLAAELDECRRQHQRLAQLTDVVQELLLPAAVRDDAKLAALLEEYGDDLGAAPGA